MKANYNKGTRTTTKGQQKKHITQMTNTEVNYILNKLAQIRKVYTIQHSKERCREKDISVDYINNHLGSFTSDNLIEYNTGRGYEHRVLVSLPGTAKADNGSTVIVKIVIDLDTCQLVTAYVNDVNDTHKTIDMKYYNKKLKII